MIQQVLNKQLLLDVLDGMQAMAETRERDGRRAGTGTPADDMGTAERAEVLDSIETAKKFAAKEVQPRIERRGSGSELSLAERNSYIPQSPELSNLQSAIEQYFLEHRPEAMESSQPADRRGGSTPVAGLQLTIWQEYLEDRRLFGRFEQTDLGWISALFAQGIRRFRGKHDFVDRPVRREPIPFADENVRIVVFGDWGSGIPRAKKVATYIRRELEDEKVRDWQKHVVHLGDVYYSGWDFEYKNRFLNDWPVKPDEKEKIGSFTLNGNHDMYSGGWGYYDCALTDERFAHWQGQSSLFLLANNHWQIFGLDTSHDDAGLKGDQSSWVCGAAQKGLKTLLLSHHPYCSSYETAPQTVIDKIQPVLGNLDVAAWLWGHEHRLITYKAVGRIRFPRCIGHGGVPVYQTHDAGSAVPAPGDWEYRDFIGDGLEHWAKFGFAVLDFHGKKISVRYVDEDGVDLAGHQETIE